MSAAVIFGGYGTFGTHVARELALLGISVVIAGRDGVRAEAFARSLGPAHHGLAVDITDAGSCRSALQGCPIAVNCAGPFAELGTTLLEACLAAGCHYVDIADDRRYARTVRTYDRRFQEQGLAAIYGCSSLPAISGALGLHLGRRSTLRPERARVTLFIGNNNPKGQAAVRSLLRGLGQPIEAPQGMLRGFRDREVVPLPAPFGKRGVFNFESPEYDLFPALLGVRSVAVKVGFELRLATYALALLATTRQSYGAFSAHLLEGLARPFRWAGTSGGAVMTELFTGSGETVRATLLGRHDGQRMAALPCVFVTQTLVEASASLAGSRTAYDFLGAESLLGRLVASGFELHTFPPETGGFAPAEAPQSL